MQQTVLIPRNTSETVGEVPMGGRRASAMLTGRHETVLKATTHRHVQSLIYTDLPSNEPDLVSSNSVFISGFHPVS